MRLKKLQTENMGNIKNHKENLIPIFIGVTGHRDLREEDIPELKSKVEAIFQEVMRKYPYSPIKVLSPLAEGADRLVAKIGLEIGCSLIVLLPMNKEEYMKDFETENIRNDFEELIRQAEDIFELPLMEGNTSENIQGYSENRDKQYAFVGAHIAANSQILIALWNGKDISETGGTASVVRFKLEGIPEPYSTSKRSLDFPESGHVYHIFTARRLKDIDVTENNHNPEVNCLLAQKENWDVLYPVGWKEGSISQAEKYYDNILKKIDDFNKDAKCWTNEKKVQESKSYLFPENKDAILIQGLNNMRSCYGFADAMAQYYQKRTTLMLKSVISTAVIAFFFFGVFDSLLPMIYVLALFPTFFCITYLIYKYTVKRNYENKFYDYRAFAEGLRVQFFWKVAGLKFNVTDYYHRKYKGEMDWIFHAIKNVSLKTNLKIFRNITVDRKQSLEAISKFWVDDQRKYFEKNAIKRRNIVVRQKSATIKFFLIAMFLVFGIFAMKAGILLQQGSYSNILDMKDVTQLKIYPFFLVLIDSFIAIGAARALYVEKRAFNEEAKQFQRMKDLFVRGSKAVREALDKNDLNRAEGAIVELGKEALTESADWLILQRSNPMDMPLG